jgi:hypothetical protein
MPVRIVGGNLRDLSYLASRLRPDDHAEVSCQIPGWTPAGLAYSALQGLAWCVLLDGNPEAAFGAREQRTGLWIIWAWGSRRMWRCVPAIKRFCLEVLMPDVLNAGALRGEARALASHKSAHTLLSHLGAQPAGLLRNYGMNGENFILFEWVRSKDFPLSAPVSRPEEVFQALASGVRQPAIGGDHLLFLNTGDAEDAAAADPALSHNGGGATARGGRACAHGDGRWNGRDRED